MPTIPISFTGSTGATLAGRLELPVGEAQAYAILAHCFTCSKDLSALVRIARGLAERGIGVLRFDFTGLGESEGELAHGGIASNVGDIVAAAEHLASQGRAPSLLIGHSLGGAACLLAAGELPSIKAVATIGAPADTSTVLRLFTGARATIEAEGEAEVAIAGRRFRITRDFLKALEADHMKAAIAGLRRALLILHAPRDQVVSVDQAAAIFTAARHPKSFISLDDADHLLSRPEDARYAAEVIAAWACRYVAAASAEAPLDARGATVAAETGRTPYRTRLRSRDHAWVADEPIDLGGQDLGPNPYDLVQAGLAACTSMTLRMYADRKGWPLERVVTRISFDRVHRDECEGCESPGPKIGRFDRRLEIVGELDDTQRARLLEIADRCPVHRLVTEANLVATRIEGSDASDV
ncbi:MAG: OsmC family protein [Myxococcales bacterium]|nr:OsmC family protein [Myxococcales bacterium]MCB9700626.1 OsmC family protein [Myxococcales bacterium]